MMFQLRKSCVKEKKSERKGLQILFQVGVTKSATVDIACNSNMQPEFGSAKIGNDQTPDMKL